MEPREGLCPVCGIEPEKHRADLTPPEIRIRFHARAIRAVAMFHLVGACLGIFMVLSSGAPNVLFILAAINLLLAFGLERYSLIAYKAATVYYFLIGMVNIISIQRGPEHALGIVLALLALYLVGNGTAKAIFDRSANGL